MLQQLYIKNYALIDTLDITFGKGFSVITGETGAGKSIILGAIGLLLGNRADSKAVKPGAQKCTIEAHFNLTGYDLEGWFTEQELDCDIEDCILRRELTASGKSRAFINDTPTPLNVVRELGEMLMDVHSQHQNLLLQKEDFQLSIIDIVANNGAVRQEYETVYNEYINAQRNLRKLREEIESSRQNEDFMRFQLEELLKADLKEGELEELESEAKTAEHTEDIKSALYEADSCMSSAESNVLSLMRTATSRLQSIANFYPKVAELAERANSTYIDIKDMSAEISDCLEEVSFDPARLEFINSRIDTIYSLQRKMRVNTVEELIAERDRLQSAINAVDNSDEELKEREALVSTLLAKAKEKAQLLTKTREKAKKKVEKDILNRLEALGMPNAEFEVEIKTDDLNINGQDRIAFLFSANKGMTLRPVAQIASGGEIARVMLSLKAIVSGVVKLPTIIFDEIDTGVSGKIAEKMADIMHEMGQSERQVIAITHLPQIASKGSAHYRVEKHDTPKGTVSLMKRLTDEERINEIAQMVSGSNISEAAIQNARQLLGL